ncbi:MAG: hypothetical protein FWE22_05380 [Firmicutes bacterium]|nr:hypothetical protein [Bacillota bacterium]
MRILHKNFNKLLVVLGLALLFVFSSLAMGLASFANGQLSSPISPETYIRPAGGGVYHYFEDARDIKFHDDNLFILNRNGGTTSYRYELVVFSAPDGGETTIDNVPYRIRIPSINSVTQFQIYGDYLFTVERISASSYSLFVYYLSDSNTAARVTNRELILTGTDVISSSRYSPNFAYSYLDFPVHISMGFSVISYSATLGLESYNAPFFAVGAGGTIRHLSAIDNNFFGVFGQQSNRVGLIRPDMPSANTPVITAANFIGITPITPTRVAVLSPTTLSVFYPEGNVLVEDRGIPLLNSLVFETNAIAICSSENYIFVLTEDEDGNNGILRICSTSFVSTPLIASMGSDDGFFHSPVDVATRGANEIGIADRDNNRVVIYDGETFTNIDIPSPSAISAGVSNFYVAHGNSITIIGPSPNFSRTLIQNIVSNQTIVDIAVSAGGDIYVLTSQGQLRRRRAGTTAFPQILEGLTDIRGIDSTPILPFVHNEYFIYAYGYVNIDGIGNSFAPIRIYDNANSDNIQIFPILLENANNFSARDTSTVQGIAKDPFGGFYLLMIDGVGNNAPHSIKRINFDGYDLGGDPIYEASYERSLNITGRFSSIHVSSVEHSRENGVLERDILAANTPRHIVQIIRSEEFGVEFPEFPTSFNGNANTYHASNRIIHHVVNPQGISVHSRPSQTGNIVATLPYEFRVIAPSGQQSGFTRIIADNLDGNSLIVGYVLTRYLSAPLPYSDTLVALSGGYLTVYRVGAVVRAFPARQSNIIPGYNSLLANETLTLLGFVYEFCSEREEIISHGFRDNFELPYQRRWFRVLVGNNLEGFICSDYAFAGLPPSETLNDNATIVMARVLRVDPSDPNSPLRAPHHAYIFRRFPPSEANPLGGMQFDPRFRDDYGNFIPLSAGTRVEVPGFSFDNTRDFTFIYFMIDGEILYGYVQTAHIDYDFINLTQIVASSILGTTGVLGGVLGFRYVKLRRRRMLGGLA